MLLHLVRHAAVAVRPAIDGAHWHLSPEGRAAAGALADEPFWPDVRAVYCSPEPKAAGTAQRIAARRGLPLRIEPDLREVGGRTWVAGDYTDAVRRYLAGDDVGWEPRDAAAARMRACIDAIVSGAQGDVAIISHGLVLSLYVGALLDIDAHATFELWSGIRFPDVCTIDMESRRLMRAFGKEATDPSGSPPSASPPLPSG